MGMIGDRGLLASALSGRCATELWTDVDPQSWLEVAYAEGVSALLARQLDIMRAVGMGAAGIEAAGVGAPSPLQEACQLAARDLAGQELSQRAMLRRVLVRLQDASIPVLVLKGMALRYWLYPQPYLRECSDIDLLFATQADAIAGADALAPLGYAMAYAPGRFANELLCRGPEGSADLDMHWALACIPALTELPDFDALRATAIQLPDLGVQAMGLAPAQALLHACLHRGSNLNARLGDRLKWLYDIHLLVVTLQPQDWQQFVHGCGVARINGLGASGLEAAVAAFGTQVPPGILDTLHAKAQDDPLDARRIEDWRYVNRCNLKALPGLSVRFHWLWERLFPSSGYLRAVYGVQAGRPWLLWLRMRSALTRFSQRHRVRSD